MSLVYSECHLPTNRKRDNKPIPCQSFFYPLAISPHDPNHTEKMSLMKNIYPHHQLHYPDLMMNGKLNLMKHRCQQ